MIIKRLITKTSIDHHLLLYLIPYTFIIIYGNIFSYDAAKLQPESLEEHAQVSNLNSIFGSETVDELKDNITTHGCFNNKLKLLPVTGIIAHWPEKWIWRISVILGCGQTLHLFLPELLAPDATIPELTTPGRNPEFSGKFLRICYYLVEVFLFVVTFCLDLPYPAFHYIKNLNDPYMNTQWILHIAAAVLLFLSVGAIMLYQGDYSMFAALLLTGGSLAYNFIVIGKGSCWSMIWSTFAVLEYVSIYICIFYKWFSMHRQLRRFRDIKKKQQLLQDSDSAGAENESKDRLL